MLSEKEKPNVDKDGFEWDSSLGPLKPAYFITTDIEWIAGYLLSLSEMELISTIKEYFPKESLTRLAKALGV